MARKSKKFIPSRALSDALQLMDSDQVTKLMGLVDSLEPAELSNAILDQFGSVVTELAFDVKSSITEDLNMKLGSYKITTEDGKYLNTANAIGNNIVFNPDGTVKKYKYTRKRETARRVGVSALYRFEAENLSKGLIKGLLLLHECLNANNFGNKTAGQGVINIRKGQNLPPEIAPYIRMVSSKEGDTWGGYVLGEFIPGLYSQPIGKGRNIHTLVINTKKHEMQVDPKFIINSTVGSLDQSRKYGREIFKKPYVHVNEIIRKAEHKAESNVDYKEFHDNVVSYLQEVLEFRTS